ncbi:16S rRNA (guanine(966)-N(2))-methyltransferase RsmD [Pseudolactococcus laudensis]|uniref:16S rRNA (guanine(966)-N(2))-methyltransferase RsmD n=1 Tax=Pseudolactococcus laudensis TaxID=1494461 RepID=UPI0002774FAB|nr:Ribosomal RNA small subunit methyltransferase D [Lactococcus raffinolactis 4877]
MRVVSGEYGGRTLKTLEGKNTRPTGDKVRAAIFSMLGQYFEGGLVLDLYSGSGGLAIEAISRGCDRAIMVEKDRQAQQVIQTNIDMTKDNERFTLMKMTSDKAISLLNEPFDLVFLDPPYAKEQIVKDIEKLEDRGLLSPDVTIVCETDKSVELPDTIATFRLIKQKTYGISKVSLYERN